MDTNTLLIIVVLIFLFGDSAFTAEGVGFDITQQLASVRSGSLL